MTNTGCSFEEFIQAAVSNEPHAKSLWDELTECLHKCPKETSLEQEQETHQLS